MTEQEQLAHRVKDSELEAQACALWRQYGFFLPTQARGFLRELAIHLKWEQLKEIIK